MWPPASSGWAGCKAPGLMTAHPILQLIGEEEDVSVYDIADHPDFRFRTTDIVIRIGNTEDGAPHKEDEVCLPTSSGAGGAGGVSLLHPPHPPPPRSASHQRLQSLEVPPGGPRRPDLQVLGSTAASSASPGICLRVRIRLHIAAP